MIFIAYAFVLLLLAGLPAVLVFRNLPLFHRASNLPQLTRVPVSVLIPARNEEAGIAAALRSVLASDWPGLEVVVMDDHSTDRTSQVVAGLALGDARLRIIAAPELPEGWNGKQHACWRLAQAAGSDLLLFMDADVRLQPDAIQRLVSELGESPAELISGFPNQEAETFGERLLIPMMHFVLLGYLPLEQMRDSRNPKFGAGCGQLFLARREAYFSCQGHRAIAASRHDGLQLPRCFRSAGFMTDLFDASDIATVRMYRGWHELVRGLLKNADEGIASSKLIVPFSVLLIGAAVLPIFSFAHALYHGWPALATLLLGVATLLSFLPRALLAKRLHQSRLAVVLHPLAVLVFVALQWIAFLRAASGAQAISWRGRQ